MRITLALTVLALLVLSPVLVACGSKDGGDGADAGGSITIYAGRKGDVVEAIVEKFKAANDIEVTVVQNKSGSKLLAQLEAEKAAGKEVADVFWVTDPAALGAAAEAGMLAKLSDGITGKVGAGWRAKDGSWVGTSGRTRVLAYNPTLVKPEDMPKSLDDLLDPKWKGKIGWAPGNGSFQAFLTAMRGSVGDEKTKAWLEGMKKNEPKVYPKNTPIVAALASGEIALGLTNHYYVTRAQVKDAEIPVKVARFGAGDIGNLVMVSGAGVLKSSKNAKAAEAFVAFLLGEAAQTYFTKDYCEYPVVSIDANERLVPLAELDKLSPEVDLSALRDHAATIEMLKAVGLQ